MKSLARIHNPDSCHGIGIEYNYDREHWDDDADAFVKSCIQHIPEYSKKQFWFHQCGTARSKDGHYIGYQFFEYFGKDVESVQSILEAINQDII